MANWIKKAVKPENKGLFAEKAKRAGMSTHAYAEKEKGTGGKLGKEANFALTMEEVRPKRRGLPYKSKKG